MRYHIHGTDSQFLATVTVTVDADNEDEAQGIAWNVCPNLDVEEIEEAA